MTEKNQALERSEAVQMDDLYRRSRGYIPHYESGQSRPQMLTFRLHDSLPKNAFIEFAEELERTGRPDDQHGFLIEECLDRGIGSCWLSNSAIAEVTQNALLHFNRERYTLHAWVIMPNHVHVLLTPLKERSLSEITHAWKSFTAKQANAILGRQGAFWQREYFDRMIRDEQHFINAVLYIHNNPLKAKICDSATDWAFSSASDVYRETVLLPGFSSDA